MKDQRISLILDHVTDTNRVLDLGCGHHDHNMSEDPYWLHKHLVNKNPSTIGLELEEDIALALNDKGYNVIAGNIEDKDLPNRIGEQFDVIVSGELIEHLANPGLLLDNAYQLLKPNGVLILSTPNPWNFFNIASSILRGRIPIHVQHTCWFDYTTLSQLTRRYNFEERFFTYLHWQENQPWRSISLFLYKLGFRRLAGAGLFFVLGKKQNT